MKKGFYYIVILFVTWSFITSCAGSQSGDDEVTSGAGPATGGVAAEVVWPSESKGVVTTNGQVKTQDLPTIITTVEMRVSAPDMKTISKSFPASAREGKIEKVPIGQYREVNIEGRDSNNNILYRGVSIVSVNTGETSSAAIYMNYVYSYPMISNIKTSGDYGDITINYDLETLLGDFYKIKVEYRGGNIGSNWKEASITGKLTDVTKGTRLSLTWNSATDEPGVSADNFQIRIIFSSTDNGIAGESSVFTVDNSPGVTLAKTAPSLTVNAATGTITDSNTGLMWLKDISCFTEQNWDSALSAIASFNAGTSTCTNSTTYTDWRMPNILELESLINYSVSNPSTWLANQGFVGVNGSDYWSSTIYGDGSLNWVWELYLYNGTISQYSPKTSNYRTFLVRGGEGTATNKLWKTGQRLISASGDDGDLQKGVYWPIPRFTDNNDGTVTDQLTGLFWLKDAGCMGQNSWGAAIANPSTKGCQGYSVSYTDWRIPSRKELLSIIDFSRVNSSTTLYPLHPNYLPPDNPFVNVKADFSSYYWTSTEYDANNAWKFNIQSNSLITTEPKANYNYIWLVRGGR